MSVRAAPAGQFSGHFDAFSGGKTVFFAFLLAVLPVDGVARDHVDRLEVNHFYNDQAEHVFTQIIFWEFNYEKARWQVRAWRMAKGIAQPSAMPYPQRDWQRGGYVLLWRDGEIVRSVHADSLIETWTQYDPEQYDRQWTPVDERRDLRRNNARAQR
jgi:hypothetical protein